MTSTSTSIKNGVPTATTMTIVTETDDNSPTDIPTTATGTGGEATLTTAPVESETGSVGPEKAPSTAKASPTATTGTKVYSLSISRGVC